MLSKIFGIQEAKQSEKESESLFLEMVEEAPEDHKKLWIKWYWELKREQLSI